MKIPFGIALALHALALGAAARWARPRPPPVSLLASDAVDVLVSPPPPDPSPPPPPEPVAPIAPGPAAPALPVVHARPAALRSAPSHAPSTGSIATPPPSFTLDRAPRAREAPPLLSSPIEVGELWSALTSGAAGGGGDGDGDGTGSGGGGRAGKRRRRGILGESWDSVAGPRREEPPEHVAAADERSLPRQTVDAVVGRSAGRLRLCYEDGLRREPDLAGLVPVRFSIDPSGTVLVASDAGSTVADPAVIRCVLAAFAAMTFPARPGGEALWATYVVALPPG